MNTIFQRTVVNTWGRAGQVWLSRLPMFIEELSSHWQLDDIQPVKNMSYHYVALARQASQTPVVLKIGCDPQLTFDEYCALKHFDGQGAVRILDINKNIMHCCLNVLFLATRLRHCIQIISMLLSMLMLS